MVKNIFHGKIILIDKTGFKYRLLSIQSDISIETFPRLLSDLEKSYRNKPYDYGRIVQKIENTLKNGGFIKNKTDFAKIIGVRNYETVYRIEKSKGYPKGKRMNTLKTAHDKLKQYFESTIVKHLPK